MPRDAPAGREPERLSPEPFKYARAGRAGRGAGEGTTSPGGGTQAVLFHTPQTRSSGAGCLVGAAEAAFLLQFDKGALIGQRDPAVVGRKESRRLIGRSAPAMRQAAVGVEDPA